MYSGVSKIKIWEAFGDKDNNLREHSGTYVVDETTATATVDGKVFMRVQVKQKISGTDFLGNFSFPTLNKTFEAEMTRSW